MSTDTLVKSRGRIPEAFLEECGFSRWEVLNARLYDPALTPAEMSEIVTQIVQERSKGYFIGGVFISYSHANKVFVDKLYEGLKKAGANVWLDRHELLAGDLEKQVQRAIRMQDVVVTVLSEASLESDWVEAELEWARNKEKQHGRDVLCPVALDGSWLGKAESSALWRQVKKKNVLDFSGWKDGGFEDPFRKLVDGLKINY